MNLIAVLTPNRPVEIIENGQSLGFATGQLFTRRAQKYVKAVYIKNERLHGPVWDAFTDPYVVLYGTSGEDKQVALTSRKIAKELSNGAPCFADTNMPEELIDSHNLILIGTAESNSWLAKINKYLPVQVIDGSINVDAIVYDSNEEFDYEYADITLNMLLFPP